MDAEHDVTEEGDEDEELQRLDGDGEEEDEADDIVVGEPKESGQAILYSATYFGQKITYNYLICETELEK